jgi:predicted kinase
MIDDKIRDAVTEAVTFWAYEKEVEDRIAKRMAYYTDELIKDEVRKRIEELKKKL